MHWTGTYIVSQVITVIYYAWLCASYILRDRRKILTANFVGHAGQAAAMALLGGYTGAAMSAIMAGRDLALRIQAQGATLQPVRKTDLAVLAATLVAIIMVAILTYDGLLSLLSVVAAFLSTVAIWQKNVKNYKFLGIIVTCLWISYNVTIGTVMGVILETILGIFAVVGYVRDKKAPL